MWMVENFGVDMYVGRDLKWSGPPPIQQSHLSAGYITFKNHIKNMHDGRPWDFPHTGIHDTDPRAECGAPFMHKYALNRVKGTEI